MKRGVLLWALLMCWPSSVLDGATRWVMRGTQGARKMDVSGINIFLISGGQIREIWVNMDALAQAEQMGRVPAVP